MTRPPEFDELFDEPLAAAESDRLRRAHELLVAAGPPAELPPSLLRTPEVRAEQRPSILAFERPKTPAEAMRRRYVRGRALTYLAAAAAIALVAFLAGYSSNGHKSPQSFAAEFTRNMHGVGTAQNASAEIVIGKVDSAGNWPMKLEVAGLKPLPRGSYYELFLTRHGKIGATCGTFRVLENGITNVRLNAPYDFRRFDGWVIAREQPGHAQQVLLTT